MLITVSTPLQEVPIGVTCRIPLAPNTVDITTLYSIKATTDKPGFLFVHQVEIGNELQLSGDPIPILMVDSMLRGAMDTAILPGMHAAIVLVNDGNEKLHVKLYAVFKTVPGKHSLLRRRMDRAWSDALKDEG